MGKFIEELFPELDYLQKLTLAKALSAFITILKFKKVKEGSRRSFLYSFVGVFQHLSILLDTTYDIYTNSNLDFEELKHKRHLQTISINSIQSDIVDAVEACMQENLDQRTLETESE